MHVDIKVNVCKYSAKVMSSITNFFRNLRTQLKSILDLEKSDVTYRTFRSEEKFPIACRTNRAAVHKASHDRDAKRTRQMAVERV